VYVHLPTEVHLPSVPGISTSILSVHSLNAKRSSYQPGHRQQKFVHFMKKPPSDIPNLAAVVSLYNDLFGKPCRRNRTRRAIGWCSGADFYLAQRKLTEQNL
jgi:hypothetical protein